MTRALIRGLTPGDLLLTNIYTALEARVCVVLMISGRKLSRARDVSALNLCRLKNHLDCAVLITVG